jgi:PAS domain-containing protein
MQMNPATMTHSQPDRNGAANVSVIASDLAGTITLFDTGAERMLGYTSEEVVGKQTPTLFHLDSEVAARSLELTEETDSSIHGFDVILGKVRNSNLPDYLFQNELIWTISQIASIAT